MFTKTTRRTSESWCPEINVLIKITTVFWRLICQKESHNLVNKAALDPSFRWDDELKGFVGSFFIPSYKMFFKFICTLYYNVADFDFALSSGRGSGFEFTADAAI